MTGGALSAGLFYGAGSLTEGLPGGSFGKVMAHAAAGCVGASTTGGSCGSGALSAGFAEFAGPKFGNDWNAAGQTFKYAILGGTASVLGGGKFQNGAMTGAFGYLFNFCAHNKCFDRPFGWGDAAMHWSVGQGEMVTDVKASEIPLGGATYIKNEDGTYQIHTFSPIYGTVTGILNTDGTMSIKPDYYNFDQKPIDSVKVFVRNTLTAIGKEVNGRNGTSYYIEFSGTVPAPNPSLTCSKKYLS